MPYDIIIGRDEEDRKQFGEKGVILLGRHYVKMGQITSLSNNIYMDVAKSHVVFIVGKRGSGKCLTGDTLVTLENGTAVPMSEIYKHKEDVLSLDNNLKIHAAPKEGFYEREVSEILKIRLRSGKEIKLTPEHPLLTIKGWTEAKNLSVGSRIATSRKIPVMGNFLEEDAKIKIIAYMIAEGHTKRPMFFSNSDEDIVDDMSESLKKLDKNFELTKLAENCYKVNSRRIKQKVLNYTMLRDKKGRMKKGSGIEIDKTPIRKLMEEYEVYGKLSREKIISQKIFQLTNSKLALFLNRLFSCDGSIYRKKCTQGFTWQISYSSSSEKLARQVQSLLLRFEILSRLRKKHIKCNNKIFESFELVVDSENVRKFITSIGFFGKKEETAKKAISEIKKSNPNVDTVPKELWEVYRPSSWVEAGKRLGYSSPKAARSSINYSVSRQKLLQIAEADCNERIKALAQSDIFWDEIVEVERLTGKLKVYDTTVPELHNFIANDIIVHNSYSMGVIAEGVADLPPEVKQNISVIMLDTMGVYWTMKYPNLKDAKLLSEWGLKPKALDVTIFTPVGYFKEYKDKGIPTDFPFSIKPNELDPDDWLSSFGISKNDEVGVLIERVVTKLKAAGKNYSIQDIIDEIEADKKTEQRTKDMAENRFLGAETWGIFDEKGTAIDVLAKGGQVTILDVSCYATLPGGWGIKSLAIGLIAKKLFVERMIARRYEEFQAVKEETHYFVEEVKKKIERPLVWLVLDEAHEFLPFEGSTVASAPLITILREGRQPGISLIMASQQPGKIHTDVMTQADTVIAHRITAKIDVDALGTLMQSYMREGLTVALDNLPDLKGSAIIFDDTNERMFPMRVRPRFTWHGGGAPVAIREEKEIFK